MNTEKRANGFLSSVQHIKLNNNKPSRMNFSAVKGQQGKYQTFVVQMPLHKLADFFEADISESPEWRSQRLVSESRARKVTNYIQANCRDYVIPCLTATIKDDVPELHKFPKLMANDFDFMTTHFDQEPDAKYGDTTVFGQLTVLSVPETSRFYFIDGQHRATGIQGLKHAASMAGLSLFDMMPDDTVSIMLRMDSGLRDRQHQFSIINSTASKTNGSLNALYEKKIAAKGVVASVIRQEFIIKETRSKWKIDYEKTACSGRNSNAFPLKTLIDSSLLMLGVKGEDEITANEEEFLSTAWSLYLTIGDSWHRYRKLNACELREATILPHSVFISGYAHFISRLRAELLDDLSAFKNAVLMSTSEVNYEKDDALWQRACFVQGRLSKRKDNIENVSDIFMDIYKQKSQKVA